MNNVPSITDWIIATATVIAALGAIYYARKQNLIIETQNKIVQDQTGVFQTQNEIVAKQTELIRFQIFGQLQEQYESELMQEKRVKLAHIIEMFMQVFQG